MPKLTEYDGSYYETEYEYAFVGLLKNEGWKYCFGSNVSREKISDVLIKDDFIEFIKRTHSELEDDQI